MKLHTENMAGNMHEAAVTINKRGWAQWLVSMTSTGHYSIAVFCMPDEAVYEIRTRDPSYSSDPHHDDPIQYQTTTERGVIMTPVERELINIVKNLVVTLEGSCTWSDGNTTDHQHNLFDETDKSLLNKAYEQLKELEYS